MLNYFNLLFGGSSNRPNSTNKKATGSNRNGGGRNDAVAWSEDTVRNAINYAVHKNNIVVDPHYYQYGEKDSRYIATKWAIDDAIREAGNTTGTFDNFISDRRDFQPQQVLPKTVMTTKAKTDFRTEYKRVSELLASEMRNNSFYDSHGKLMIKKKYATYKK